MDTLAQTPTLLLNSSIETLYMVGVSGLISILFGVPLGILLFTTRPDGVLEQAWINRAVAFITNTMRSVPFIILLIAILPLTRLIVGTSIGTTAAIVPLALGAIPFVGRIVENALEEVPSGLIEAGHAMGAKPRQIIHNILLPEALPGIINGITVTLVTLISYSAMAGAVGGGGLGDLAIRYGYQRFEPMIMLYTVIILVVMVQLLQYCGDWLSRKMSRT